MNYNKKRIIDDLLNRFKIEFKDLIKEENVNLEERD